MENKIPSFEENLDSQLKDLVNLALLGDKSSILKIPRIADIILPLNKPKIIELNNEINSYINKNTCPLAQELFKCHNLQGFKISNKIIHIKSVNLLELIPVVFKNKELFFIKVILLFNPEISQKLIILENIKREKINELE